MLATHKLFQSLLTITGSMALAASPVLAGGQEIPELRGGMTLPRQCRDATTIHSMRGPAEGSGRRFSESEAGSTGGKCDERGYAEPSAISAVREDSLLPNHSITLPAEKSGTDLHLGDFHARSAIGPEKLAIAHARAAVLDILENENACSAWFAEADPRVAETFSSLVFWVEKDGAAQVISELDDRGHRVQYGPYIARTSQSTGSGSSITINANGAFFHQKGEVFKIDWIAAPLRSTHTWQPLHVGPFDGATTQAQILTFLHELGHIVGAIPSDDDFSPSGLNRSQQNTELVLKHCKAVAKATAKRTTVAASLPKSTSAATPPWPAEALKMDPKALQD